MLKKLMNVYIDTVVLPHNDTPLENLTELTD